MNPTSETGIARSLKCALDLVEGDETGVRKTLLMDATSASGRLWGWYLDREIAIYEALAREGVTRFGSVQVPRLLAVGDGALITQHLPGRALARRRHDPPRAEVWPRLVDLVRALRASPVLGPPASAPPAIVRAMRRRLLEDPSAPLGWMTEGLERAAELGVVSGALAARARAALASDPVTSFAHGDLLLRNFVLAEDGTLGLVDWECAGAYLRSWDAALLWVAAPPPVRAELEALDEGSPAFLACVAFALSREIHFRARRGAADPVSQRLRSELAEIGRRL